MSEPPPHLVNKVAESGAQRPRTPGKIEGRDSTDLRRCRCLDGIECQRFGLNVGTTMWTSRDPDFEIVRALRRQRRRRRVEDLEWFEVLYRVYLVALGGGSLVLWLSSFVRDRRLDQQALDDVRAHGAAGVGLVVAVAAALGIRSGSQGGPLAVEEPDVRHVLLSPVSRAAALRAPTWQRLRSVSFAGLVGGAIGGQLIGRRLPGSIYNWGLSGAAVGAVAGLLYVALAVIIHVARWKRWQATALAATMIAVQGAAAANMIPAGPFDGVGSLLLWPIRIRWIDLVSVGVAVMIAACAWVWVDRLSIEHLARRSSLVSQLRFAATMQDLRTVVLLRRQLSLEQARSTPWFRAPRLGGPTLHRGVQSIARFPGRRLGRITILSLGAAGLGVIAYRGWTPAVIAGGLAWFLVGLEAIEPLSQELDHPERTELLPVDIGALHHRLLLPSALLIAIIGLIAGLIGGAIEGARSDLATCVAAGVLIGVPAALCGGLAAVFNAIGGAPDLVSPIRNGALMPPEVAGMTTMMSLVFPPAVSIVGSLPIVLVRQTVADGGHPLSTALRSAIALIVLLIIGAWWVRSRPAFKAWWAKAQEESGQMRKRPVGGV